MLPKSHRLSGYRIPEIIRTGRRTSGTVASLIYTRASDHTHPSRITVIVPMRLSKKAVERNRTKRLLRESIHTLLDTVSPGYEIIVMAQKLLKEETLSDIKPSVHDLFEHAGVISHS